MRPNRILIFWLVLLWSLPMTFGVCFESNGELDLTPGLDIELQLGTSRVLKTSLPVTRVSVADEIVADVNILTPTQILLVAHKTPGETTLIVWFGDEISQVHHISTAIPEYYRDVIQKSIEEIAPGAKVSVHLGQRGVVLQGMVEDQQQLQAVQTAARMHVSAVVSLIDVASLLEERIKEMEPESHVQVTMASSGLILRGETTGIEQANRIATFAEAYVRPMTVENLMSVRGSQQVQLEVTVAEISHSNIKQMGMGYLYSGQKGGVGLYPNGTANSGAGFEKQSSRNESENDVKEALVQLSSLVTEAEMSSPFSSAFQIVGQSYSHDAVAMLNVLKGEGLAKVLAKPTLVTMSGQEADFLVGGEFPVPVSSDEGQTNIEYQSYGVQLRFCPMVVDKDTITLKVAPEFSSPDLSLGVQSGGVSVPGIKTRRSDSTLQLKDGQTFVMAGLLREETSQIVQRVPFLGSIPLVGTLFTSKEWQKEETELVIIVKPSLVAALNSDAAIEMPGQHINMESGDVDFFLLNKTRNDRIKQETDVPNMPEQTTEKESKE